MLGRLSRDATLPLLVVALERIPNDDERDRAERDREKGMDQEDTKGEPGTHSANFLTLLCMVLSEMPNIFAARVLFPFVWDSV